MRYLFFLLLIFFIPYSSFSQGKLENKIDSLKEKVKTSNNTEKLKLYFELFKTYRGKNLDSAEYYSKKSHELALKSKDEKTIGHSWHNLGNMQFDRAMNKESLKSFKKAIEIGLKLQDSILLSGAYKDLGGLYNHLGNLNLSIKNILKALPIVEKLNNQINIANTYLELAHNLHRTKKFKEALVYNKKALIIYKKAKNKISEGITYNNLSNSLNGLMQYEKSINQANKAINIFNNSGYSRFIAYPTGNKAIAYDSLKKYKIAESLYLKSIRIHEKNKDHYELAFLKNSLANLFLKNKNFTKAINIAKESLESAKKAQALEFETFSSKTLARTYEKAKKHKLSVYFYKKYAILKDSLFKIDERKSQLQLKEQYQSVKKEKEITQQKEQLLKNELKIKNQNLYALLLASALIILGIISIGYYKKNQFKRKQLQKEIDLKEALTKIQTQNKLQEQRLRISRDLHDNIGSQLTFIISSIDNLKYVSKSSNEKLKNKLSSISSFTSDTIFQLRDTIWAMNKSEITFDDLHARVLSFVEKAKTATNSINFIVDNQIDTNFSFTSIVGINLFRVLQEAVNNSIKYAEAAEIKIKMIVKNNTIHFNVSDNGKGFDIEKTSIGNGLQNMEKRMSEIKGKVILKSTIGKGTIINITIQI